MNNTLTYRRKGLKLLDGLLMPFKFFDIQKFREATSYQPVTGDVFIVSYPKSGTTWMQYIVWELMNDGIEPPFINQMWFTYGAQIELVGVKTINLVNPNFPRQIKSHLPFNYVPYNQSAKYIYICRSPWEVCVSYYKDVKENPDTFGFVDGTFSQFFQGFIDGETAWGDYFNHIQSWYKERSRENILLITYEELKFDHRGSIVRIANFLGKDFAEKLQKDVGLLERIVKYTDFEYMKNSQFIMPANENVVKKRGFIDAGKNVDLVKTGDFRMQLFFNVGKTGYGKQEYNEDEKKQMQKRIDGELKKMPHLVHTWNKCCVKLIDLK